MPVTDTDTARTVQRLLTEARRNGISPVDALARSRLLLTPQRRKDIRLEALRDLQRSMEQWRPAEFARRVSHTDPVSPAEMLDTVMAYVEEFIMMEVKS